MTVRNLEVSAVDRDATTSIYTLAGDLYGLKEGYAFQEQVRTRIARGARKIVLDLAAIERIDSSGIGILVSVMFSASHAGGGMVLAAISARVEKVLGIAMLLDRIERAASVDEALEKLDGMTIR